MSWTEQERIILLEVIAGADADGGELAEDVDYLLGMYRATPLSAVDERRARKRTVAAVAVVRSKLFSALWRSRPFAKGSRTRRCQCSSTSAKPGSSRQLRRPGDWLTSDGGGRFVLPLPYCVLARVLESETRPVHLE
jgi:hypothetical protein